MDLPLIPSEATSAVCLSSRGIETIGSGRNMEKESSSLDAQTLQSITKMQVPYGIIEYKKWFLNRP